MILLLDLLQSYSPRSYGPLLTWEDEERNILARACLCCGHVGHYQHQLEAHLQATGLTQGVCLGDDGFVWDGHHRIVAARRLDIMRIPLESRDEADARWLRDHGPISWEERIVGDRVPGAPDGLRR